ncbi:MAG: FAD:protein FMN transferase [Alphaproteobacteria bacterium]|nr:FAD:protein FMN transferase [Alphaproteobacteria bacterium]
MSQTWWQKSIKPIAARIVGLAARKPDAANEHQATIFVFGTKLLVTLRGIDAATAQAATAKLEQQFQHMQRNWNAWKSGELTDLNQAIADGRSMAVSPHLLGLIEMAKRFESLSDGLFNPALGGIVGAWGFHSDERPMGYRPDLPAISTLALRKPTMGDVSIEGTVVACTNKWVQFDFGGFAKGVALDMAEETLKSFGIQNALLNAGGDINSMGNGGACPWRISIRDPKSSGVIAVITLAPDEKIYTSGNYERFHEIDGVRFAHTLDPRSGIPVDHIISATVIADSGALADATATALTVAGPRDWHRIARKMGVKYALLVDERGGIHLNPEMRARISFSSDRAFTLIESPPL